MRIKYSPALLLPLVCLTACNNSNNNTDPQVANDITSMETVTAENDIFVFLYNEYNNELAGAFYTNVIMPEIPGLIAETFIWTQMSPGWTDLETNADDSGTADTTGRYILTPSGWQHFIQPNVREANFDDQGALVLTSSYGDFQLTYKLSISEAINLEGKPVNSMLELNALADSPSVFPEGAKQFKVKLQDEDEYIFVDRELCVNLAASEGHHECRSDYIPVLTPGAELLIKDEEALWQIPVNLTVADMSELTSLYSQENDNWLTLPIILGNNEHSIRQIQLADNFKLNLKGATYTYPVEGKVLEQQGELELFEINGEQLYLIHLPEDYKYENNRSVLFLTEHNQKVYFGTAYFSSASNNFVDQTFVNKIALESLKLELEFITPEIRANNGAQLNQNILMRQFKF